MKTARDADSESSGEPERGLDAAAREDECLELDPEVLTLWDTAAPSSSSSSDSTSASSSTSSASSSAANGSKTGSKRSASEMAGRTVSQEQEHDKQPGRGKEPEQAKARDRTSGLSFGFYVLVPRHKKGSLSGFQMLCKNHVDCSKELSNSVSGSLAQTRWILKAWIFAGHTCPSRQEHMRPDLRQTLLAAARHGRLIQEDSMDELMRAGCIESPFIPDLVSSQTPATGDADAGSAEILGDRGDASVEVHLRMQSMARRGELPITSLSQRMRNRISSQTAYEVPSAFKEAVAHSYLHPNTGAPPPRTSLERARWHMAVGATSWVSTLLTCLCCLALQ